MQAYSFAVAINHERRKKGLTSFVQKLYLWRVSPQPYLSLKEIIQPEPTMQVKGTTKSGPTSLMYLDPPAITTTTRPTTNHISFVKQLGPLVLTKEITTPSWNRIPQDRMVNSLAPGVNPDVSAVQIRLRYPRTDSGAA